MEVEFPLGGQWDRYGSPDFISSRLTVDGIYKVHQKMTLKWPAVLLPCLFQLISRFSVEKSKKPTQTLRLKSDCWERRFRGNHGDNVNHDSHQRVPELASLVSNALFSLLPFVSPPTPPTPAAVPTAGGGGQRAQELPDPCAAAPLLLLQRRRPPFPAAALSPTAPAAARPPSLPSLTPDLRRPRASCAAAPFFPPLEQRRRPLTRT